LIQIKVGIAPTFSFLSEKRGKVMPTETAIVITGIVLLFSIFVIVLAWADYYTRHVRTPGAQYFGASDPAE